MRQVEMILNQVNIDIKVLKLIPSTTLSLVLYLGSSQESGQDNNPFFKFDRAHVSQEKFCVQPTLKCTHLKLNMPNQIQEQLGYKG